MGGVGSGVGGPGPGDRFSMMGARDYTCRCRPSGVSCSPACEACRCKGITRMHPRRDYNRGGTR